LKKNLLKQKKLILILDLDNTLIHSTPFRGFINRENYYGKFDRERNIW